MLKTALYTAAALALLAGVSSIIPALTKDASGQASIEDRIELARLRLDAGQYEDATRLFREIESVEEGKYRSRIAIERSRLEQTLLRQNDLVAELRKISAASTSSTADRLRRANRLVGEASDLEELSDDARLLVATLERQQREESSGADTEVDELERMSDSFLDVSNFAGARGVWASLSESDLACDVELQAAAFEEIEASAHAEANRLLARAEEIADRKDFLGALIVLDESELNSFRGTQAFKQLDRRAMEYEANLGPRERPAALVRREAAAKRGPNVGDARPLDAGHATEPDESTRPTIPDAPVSSGDVDEAVALGDALFSGGDLSGARDSYGAAMSSRLGFAERQTLARRIERANRAQWFLDALRNEVEASPARASTLSVATRDGGTTGQITGVEDGGFILGGGEGVAPSELASSSVHALAKIFKLGSEDRLNYAYFCMIDDDRDRVDMLLLKTSEDPSLKTSVDSAIAFLRGMNDVPEWGFFRHEGGWLTFRERELARNLEAVHGAVARLDKKDAENHAAGLEELKGLVPVAREEIVRLLYERRKQMLAELLEQGELVAIARLGEQRRALDERRETALAKIFDTDWYFYPYNPPACPPDKAALYPKRQQEVDKLVDEVREMWGNEFSEVDGGVNLSSRFVTLLERIRAEQKLLAVADPDHFTEEQQFATFRLLPRGRKVTLRNIALDTKERKRLDRDVQVLAHNANEKTVALSQEKEQVWITNCYRLMMGRQAVAWNDKLIKAARGHCEWMSKSGKFSHFNDEDPNLRTPGDRIKAQGYIAGGAGENIAMSGGARSAHDAWIHSSGHHRNILFPSHQELGSGNMGSYWCQNFAGGAEYSGNLVEFGN